MFRLETRPSERAPNNHLNGSEDQPDLSDFSSFDPVSPRRRRQFGSIRLSTTAGAGAGSKSWNNNETSDLESSWDSKYGGDKCWSGGGGPPPFLDPLPSSATAAKSVLDSVSSGGGNSQEPVSRTSQFTPNHKGETGVGGGGGDGSLVRIAPGGDKTKSQPAPPPLESFHSVPIRETGAIPKKRKQQQLPPSPVNPDQIICLPLDDITPPPGSGRGQNYYNYAH